MRLGPVPKVAVMVVVPAARAWVNPPVGPEVIVATPVLLLTQVTVLVTSPVELSE